MSGKLAASIRPDDSASPLPLGEDALSLPAGPPCVAALPLGDEQLARLIAELRRVAKNTAERIAALEAEAAKQTEQLRELAALVRADFARRECSAALPCSQRPKSAKSAKSATSADVYAFQDEACGEEEHAAGENFAGPRRWVPTETSADTVAFFSRESPESTFDGDDDEDENLASLATRSGADAKTFPVETEAEVSADESEAGARASPDAETPAGARATPDAETPAGARASPDAEASPPTTVESEEATNPTSKVEPKADEHSSQPAPFARGDEMGDVPPEVSIAGVAPPKPDALSVSGRALGRLRSVGKAVPAAERKSETA